MNADDRAKPAGGHFFPPVSDVTAATADAAAAIPEQVPTSGEVPTTGTVPQRTALRPAASAQYATRPGTRATPTAAATQTSGVIPPPPASAAQPIAGAAPTQPLPAMSAFTTSAAATMNVGVDKLKGFAAKARESLTEGDDISASRSKGGPRKARVLLSRIDPWSALKMGFLLSIAIGIMTVVAVFVLWSALNQMGVFAMVNEWILKLFTEDQELDLLQFTSLSKVMSATVLLSIINVVLLSALTTIGAFLYNTVSSVVGGVYVTLTDD